MKWTNIVALVVVVGGLAFGFWGGEYSTLDWWTLKKQVRAERQALGRLEIEIDSLSAWAELLETDPVTQERVAREKFGMLREGEILYRVEPGERSGR